MKNSVLLLLLFAVITVAQSQENFPDLEEEKKAIMQVIMEESKGFWDKDFDLYASHWVHAPYVRTMGWWAEGGIHVAEGWQTLSKNVKKMMQENPEPNPQNPRRENINIRISENMAWVTFDQYGSDTGEIDFDMPGLSYETRVLEKHNGQWKIVYVGWLLEGANHDQ